MKKILIMLLCMLLLFTGCGKTKKISGRIAHIYGATLLVAGEDGELYTALLGEADTNGEKIAAGQYAEIVYDGEVMETYPAQLSNVRMITVSKETSNLVDVYVAVIKEILKEDIQPVEKLAYDFGETELLTEGEQQAVGYMCWTELDAMPYFGTREELLEQGVIQQNEKKETYLPNGWLLEFSRDEEDPLLLHIDLWRNNGMKRSCEYLLREEEPGEWHYTRADG